MYEMGSYVKVEGTLRSIATFGGKVVKSAIKTTIDFACNKQVSLDQVLGKWRLHQEVSYSSADFRYPWVSISSLDSTTAWK